MAPADGFHDLARYYDRIMDHVDYDRWRMITIALSDLLPRDFTHLDTACGTCLLVKSLRHSGWRSFGFDLSHAMVHAGRKGAQDCPAAVADLRAAPFHGSLDYATCLFDSMNFLLDKGDMRRALRELAGTLRDGGLLYFDVVTERMVLEHFADQQWTERNGGFTTRWECDYDRKSRVSETRIRVNSGPVATIYERMYEPAEVEEALKATGLELLGAFDAESWRAPGRKTVRIDYIAVKGDASALTRGFKTVRNDVRRLFK